MGRVDVCLEVFFAYVFCALISEVILCKVWFAHCLVLTSVHFKSFSDVYAYMVNVAISCIVILLDLHKQMLLCSDVIRFVILYFMTIMNIRFTTVDLYRYDFYFPQHKVVGCGST